MQHVVYLLLMHIMHLHEVYISKMRSGKSHQICGAVSVSVLRTIASGGKSETLDVCKSCAGTALGIDKSYNCS